MAFSISKNRFSTSLLLQVPPEKSGIMLVPYRIAFDDECFHNRQVLRQLLKARFYDAKKYKFDINSNILTWCSNAKGIDATRLCNCQIAQSIFSEWLRLLKTEFRYEALTLKL